MFRSQRAVTECCVTLQPLSTIARCLSKHGPRGTALVRDDVADGPRATGPDGRKIPRGFSRVVAASWTESRERHLQRRCESCTRGFRQNAHAAMIQGILARGRPLIVCRIRRDARLPFSGHPPCHRHAQRIGADREHRIDVGFQRIHVRRNKNASGVRALLMNIVHDLGVPRRVQRIDGIPCLWLRKSVPVTVVVVPRVLVIQLGGRCSFGRRAHRLSIPIANNIHPIRILTRHQHDNGVFQNLA